MAALLLRAACMVAGWLLRRGWGEAGAMRPVQSAGVHHILCAQHGAQHVCQWPAGRRSPVLTNCTTGLLQAARRRRRPCKPTVARRPRPAAAGSRHYPIPDALDAGCKAGPVQCAIPLNLLSAMWRASPGSEVPTLPHQAPACRPDPSLMPVCDAPRLQGSVQTVVLTIGSCTVRQPTPGPPTTTLNPAHMCSRTATCTSTAQDFKAANGPM